MSRKVKLINLTKLERKCLVALLESQRRVEDEYEDRPEGNWVYGIAEKVYGPKVLNPYTNLRVTPSAMSSLSRCLNGLWRKGLVYKCKPIYRRYWYKDEVLPGHMTRDLVGLEAYSYGTSSPKFIPVGRFDKLPHRCRVWWMLTDEGREIAIKLPEIQQKLRQRCKSCRYWGKYIYTDYGIKFTDTEQCSIGEDPTALQCKRYRKKSEDDEAWID